MLFADAFLLAPLSDKMTAYFWQHLKLVSSEYCYFADARLSVRTEHVQGSPRLNYDCLGVLMKSNAVFS